MRKHRSFTSKTKALWLVLLAAGWLVALPVASAIAETSVSTYQYDPLGRIISKSIAVPSTIDTDGDGIPDYLEIIGGTNPNSKHSDNDGIEDGIEDTNHNGRIDPGEGDPLTDNIDYHDDDNDGLIDYLENLICTDYQNEDSDGDLILDGNEDKNHNGIIDPGESDPCNKDTDSDGILDGIEDVNHNGIFLEPGEGDPLTHHNDYSNSDTDNLIDYLENLIICLDPNDSDSDDDGIIDSLEEKNGNGLLLEPGETSPCDKDSDDDGLDDGVEDANKDGLVDVGETSPVDTDTDGDSIQDGTESGVGVAPSSDTNPTVFIPDVDTSTTTNPLSVDSDGDTIQDGIEDNNKNGRVDAGEINPLSKDSDGDGISDRIEYHSTGGQPTVYNGPTPDNDVGGGDGLSDYLENLSLVCTSASNRDSDSDGLIDGSEDTNANGEVDGGETNPCKADSDGDGMPDGSDPLPLVNIPALMVIINNLLLN